MSVKLLTEHHLEFLSLTGGCRGSSESTLVKMPHCWKSHATAHRICSEHDYSRTEAKGQGHSDPKTVLTLCNPKMYPHI